MQPLPDNIPHMFDESADLVVHLLLLKSSMVPLNIYGLYEPVDVDGPPIDVATVGTCSDRCCRIPGGDVTTRGWRLSSTWGGRERGETRSESFNMPQRWDEVTKSPSLSSSPGDWYYKTSLVSRRPICTDGWPNLYLDKLALVEQIYQGKLVQLLITPITH